jgi:hypothetical protein
VQARSQAELITQRYSYDAAERLAWIKYVKAEGQAGEQVIEQLGYQYDAAGRRTAKTALNNSGLGHGETPMSASYDAASRITAITLTLGATAPTYALSHDANGNLTQKKTAPTSPTRPPTPGTPAIGSARSRRAGRASPASSTPA